MSLQELAMCVEGYNKAHGGEPALLAPDDAQFEALKANAAEVTRLAEKKRQDGNQSRNPAPR